MGRIYARTDGTHGTLSVWYDRSALTPARAGPSADHERPYPRRTDLCATFAPLRTHGNAPCTPEDERAPEVCVHKRRPSAAGGDALQPRIDHTAWKRGAWAFPPVSKQRNRQERQIPSLCAYSLCTPCTLWWRPGRLPASCQLGSGVLVACLACAQASDTGIKTAGMRLQSLPVCSSHPLPLPSSSLCGILRRVFHSQTAHCNPITSPPVLAPPLVSSLFSTFESLTLASCRRTGLRVMYAGRLCDSRVACIYFTIDAADFVCFGQIPSHPVHGPCRCGALLDRPLTSMSHSFRSV